MDLFTQSVDASLQSSRAFDDPSHFHNPSAAAASRSSILPTPSKPVHATHLIIPLGHLPSLALQALDPSPLPKPSATFSAPHIPPIPLQLPTNGLLKHNAIVSLSDRTIDDSSAFQFAQALIHHVQTTGIILVVCAATRVGVWAGVHGVRVLATTAVDDKLVGDLARLKEPALLGGVAGAVMAEAEMRGRKAVCVAGDSRGGGVSVDEVLQVMRVIKQLAGVEEEVGVDEVRRVMGRGGGPYDGIYM